MPLMPSAVLHHPYPKEPIPNLVNEILGAGDWLSPSHVMLKAIEFCFGFNPGEEVATWVGGDWEEVATIASALTQLGEYATALGSAINAGNVDMAADWDGNAATSAQAYFDQLATQIDALGPHLNRLSGDYMQVAAGMQEMTAAIASLLEYLADKLLAMGVKAAAAALTSETVVGGVLFGAWAAHDAYKVWQTWQKIIDAHSAALGAAQATIGLMAGALGVLETFPADALPKPYNHPGALS